MSIKHPATAVAYLQGALHELDQERKREGGNSKELSVAYTNIETALLWMEKDVEFKGDDDARPRYAAKKQPYLPPSLYDTAELAKLTLTERIGMFGYDPLESEE